MGTGVPDRGTGVDVGAWLRGLGLGQYEPAFRENDVDADVLPELTEADLERLGVAPLGPRKKLLRGISALRAGSAPSLHSATARSWSGESPPCGPAPHRPHPRPRRPNQLRTPLLPHARAVLSGV